MIHAFVSTRLDYCNSLYMGINQSVFGPVFRLYRMPLPGFLHVFKGVWESKGVCLQKNFIKMANNILLTGSFEPPIENTLFSSL